jgi:hypothetical protein
MPWYEDTRKVSSTIIGRKKRNNVIEHDIRFLFLTGGKCTYIYVARCIQRAVLLVTSSEKQGMQ